jgi:hypothetical protein
MAGPGHNNGPSMDEGKSWREHCWRTARAALLPHLPIEVVRIRLRRAQELGLDYRTYAGIRATTGRDVIAFLFSSNALVPLRGADLPEGHRARLAALTGADRVGLARPPLSPERLAALAGAALDRAAPAPGPWAPFAAMRAALDLARGGLPADGVVLVGDGPDEPDWAAAGRLAAFLPAGRYFAPRP